MEIKQFYIPVITKQCEKETTLHTVWRQFTWCFFTFLEDVSVVDEIQFSVDKCM
jgi:hypothetical protein